MYDKSRKYSGLDMIKEIIWTFLFTLASYVYWVVLLLIISFVFNSIIDLSFRDILIISVFLSICMMIYRIIRTFMKSMS
jgi:hypothetical protein